MCVQRRMSDFFLYQSPFHSLQKGSLLKLESSLFWLVWLAVNPPGSTFFHPQMLGLWALAAMPSFLTWMSGPMLAQASAPTQLPLVFFPGLSIVDFYRETQHTFAACFSVCPLSSREVSSDQIVILLLLLMLQATICPYHR